MMHFFAGFFIATLVCLLAPARADAGQCPLFPDGVQEIGVKDLKVTDFSGVLMHCRKPSPEVDERIAIRRFKVKGTSYLVLVDSSTMHTELMREGCFICSPIAFESLETTRYGSAVARLARDFKTAAHRHVLINAGLKSAETTLHGAVVTADLCPTVKPLSRGFFQEIASLQKQAPVALSVSGVWMDRHAADLEWLKTQVRDGKIDVTWVNHSHHHAFRNDHTTEGNYMLLPQYNVENEILSNERIMIEHGITPSVFFRFPALVSDVALMEAVKKHMLIPLAANAWLAQGQQPHDHSIILVHANGNERGGLVRFRKLAEEKQLPLPMLPLLLAPRLELKTENPSSQKPK